MLKNRRVLLRRAIALGCALSCVLIGLVSGLFAVATPRAQTIIAHAERPLTNPIITENALPGTDEWANIGNYNISALAAYPGATSVNAGDPIPIYVKGTGSSLSARLYRLGYYQNHGARLITTYSGISLASQPNCTRVRSTGLVRCPWSSAFSVNTDPSWVSGVYLLRLDSSNGYRFFVYFIVRNDSSTADFLFVEASKTNQAYNDYGGESLYGSTNNEGRVRAYQVSFDRPYNSGAGTGGFFTHDVDMVRWLEASGYDVTYVSDVDQATNPNFMQGHRVLLEIGHPEYWSWNERDNVDAALASGNKSIVFASANVSWWNVRLEASSVGPNRVITCYKDSTLDPTPVAPYVTVEFDGPLLQRPENQLTGVNYQSYADDSVINAPWVLAAPTTKWYFDCTGLQAGDQVNNVIGEEWDAVVNNGRSPSGLEILSQSTVINPHGLPTLSNSVIFTTTNGAKVFSSGSIHWSWGLIDHSYPNEVFQSYAVSNDADHRTEQLMANILDSFAGYWDGSPRGCGPGNQSFYDIGVRATRTPKPQVATATGTRPTATRTRTPYATLTSTTTPTASSTPTLGYTNTATSTPTTTLTPINTPVCTVTRTETGAITTTDPTQIGRVARNGVASSCDVPKSGLNPADTPTPFHYDAYTYTNSSSGPACITVHLDNTGCGGLDHQVITTLYIGAFDPNNIQTNYGGDPGQSELPQDFSVVVPGGQSFTIVISEEDSNHGCASYTLTVSGIPCLVPINTPTRTSTPTSTRTRTPAITLTPTATPSATPCPGNITVEGSITTGDSRQRGRIARDHSPSVCGTIKPCPSTVNASLRYYDSYSFANNTSSDRCVTISLITGCSGNNDLFSVAYLGSYHNTNLCVNYIGDIGYSPGELGGTSTYSIDVPAGATFVVIVHEINPGAGCADYTLTLDYCYSSTPAPTVTTLVTETPTSVPQIVGHVTWLGRAAQPDPLQELPISLTLKMDSLEINYPFQNTDASGFFTASIDGLPDGTYDWRVKSPQYLANSGTVALTQGQPVNTEMGGMRAGDCNDDNLVNGLDFNIFKPAFGEGIGDPSYDVRADFTGDQAVTIQDFNLLKVNFGLGGAPPLVP